MILSPWTDEERAACLDCPECGEPAIPASGKHFVCLGREIPTWTEDDEAECPGCGVQLVARMTGDSEDEWMEARVKADPVAGMEEP